MTDPAASAEPTMAASVPERIGPYQVECRLGEGGMGKVYKAYDQQLDRRVAIKLILSADDADDDTRQRFRREARAAARLSHSSIVQVYHLLEVDRDDYIVMEYVEGRTLAEVVRDGPVGLLLALSLAHDIAAGLAEAHAHGIVHRDLKTENVIVTPGNRAKILDFGLAKPIWAGQSEVPLTGKGNILGTCRAMSPEQANGLNVDHRSDLFSFGTLLFETATGRSPFSAPTPVATLIQVCYHRPPPANNLNPEIPETFSELIDRLLAKDPNQRPPSAANVTAILEQIADDSLHQAGHRGVRPSLIASPRAAPAEESSSGALLPAVEEESDSSSSTFPWLRLTPTTAPELSAGRSWWRRRGLLIAGLAGLLVAVFVAGFFLSRLRRAPPPIAAEDSLMSLAVLGFKNLSGNPDTEWMSTAISEVFSAELAASQQLYVIPGESVARMRLELAIPDADTLAIDTLAKIRRNSGADLVMLGSYLAVDPSTDGQIRLQVRVQETRKGKEVATASESAPRDQLLDLVTRVGTSLRARLGISQAAIHEARAARATISSSPEATRLYSEGLAKLRRYDALAARDLLQRAVEIDPSYALAHAALSEAWLTLHYDARAEESALRALELAADLPREAILMIEARRYEAAADWQKAIGRYEVLSGYYPENLDHGLRLAHAQTKAGEGEAAMATLAELRRLPPPAGEDPRIDLAEAVLARSRSDFKGLLAAAQRAVEKGQNQQAWILVANARRAEGWALMLLGQQAAAAASLQDAWRLFGDANDRGNVAETLSDIANLQIFEGKLAEATATYREALAIMRQIGYRERVAATQSNLATVALQQGDLTAAMEMLREAIGIARQIGVKGLEAAIMINMALVLTRQGNLPEAERMAQESLAISEAVGERRASAWNGFVLGQTAFAAGRLSAARARYEQAQAIWEEIGTRHLAANVGHELGKISLAEADLEGASEALREAEEIQSQIGDQGSLAATRSTLAVVLLERGNHSQAEAQARESATEFAREGMRDDEAVAWSTVARALLAQGRLAAAREAAAHATASATASENPQVRLCTAATAARLLAEEDSEAALEQIAAVVAEAKTLGLGGIELEARRIWGVIELVAGDLAAGRGRLAALAMEAEARGFHLISRQAAERAR